MEEKDVIQFLNETNTLAKAYEILAKSTGEEFNIFSILQMEYDENFTHSRFIAELLRKEGSHKQGNIFLKLFCEQFQINDFDDDNYIVKTEFFIGNISKDYLNGGRIDIFIKDKNDKVIMIENKINAGEQKYQLIRYKAKFPNGELFFLTLDGKDSDCKKTKDIELKYSSISYSTDIINWLENCKKSAIDTPMLREVISQYIYLLKKITNQNTNKEMSKEITHQILTNQDKFKSFKYLIGIENNLYREVFQKHILDFVEEIAKEYDMKFDYDPNFLNGAIYNGFGLENEKFEALNLIIRFDFEATNFKAPLFGLAFLNKDKEFVSKFDYTEIREKFKNIFPNAVHNDNFACYYIASSESWRNLNKVEEIVFGDFKNDLKDKIIELINIIN